MAVQVEDQSSECRTACTRSRLEAHSLERPRGPPPRWARHVSGRSGSLTMSGLRRLVRHMAASASRAPTSSPDWCRNWGLSGTALHDKRSRAAGSAMITVNTRHLPSKLGRNMEATTAKMCPETKNTCIRAKQDSLTDGGVCSTRRETAAGRKPPAPRLVTARKASSDEKSGDAADARPPATVTASAAMRAGRRPHLSAMIPKPKDPAREQHDCTEFNRPQSSGVVPQTVSSST
mmetsp:Transcript_45648/g.136447  ORF Transcript_45648/g.136447 Transcript_45648/m.136447 type:complete len:234 (+) Transcript_45648:543-1244(+)